MKSNLPDDLLLRISSAITFAGRCYFSVRFAAPIHSEHLNQYFRLDGEDGRHYFLKLNNAQDASFPPALPIARLAAEAAGLHAIAATNTLTTPQVIAHGNANGQTFLVLEHLELRPRGDERQLGAQLAALHRCTADHFGFTQDNFIGTTHQPNNWNEDWIVFWREQRLGHQLQLAARNGHTGEMQTLGRHLLDVLPAFFDGYIPQPSLLHGDLWGGNHGFLADGTPVIFDPAVYYGDRECDLAMTELFGGYGAAFYAAYRAAWPLHEGYALRRELYNLYHILNHANLFGGGYARQAECIMRSLLAAAC